MEMQLEMFEKGPKEQLNFRMPKAMWEAFKERAHAQGVPASLILRQLVKEYIEENQQLELVSRNKRK